MTFCSHMVFNVCLENGRVFIKFKSLNISVKIMFYFSESFEVWVSWIQPQNFAMFVLCFSVRVFKLELNHFLALLNTEFTITRTDLFCGETQEAKMCGFLVLVSLAVWRCLLNMNFLVSLNTGWVLLILIWIQPFARFTRYRIYNNWNWYLCGRYYKKRK